MGTVCARCSEVKRAKGERPPLHPEFESEGSEEEEGQDDKEVVAVSSEEDGAEEDYRQGVAETLRTTGRALKRGRTMAMKEAISTAKKLNVEAATVAEAEKQLDAHKRRQRREEAERAAEAFLGCGESGDRATCEIMLRRVVDAECSKELVERLKAQLQEIIITRDLEDEELLQAHEYMKENCRAFVLSATKRGGRPVLLLDLESGAKLPSRLSLDPPLQSLGLRQEDEAELDVRAVPLCSLAPRPAREDKAVRRSAGFKDLEDGEGECALAVAYESAKERGVWCFVESTPERRDRLIEAFVVLAAISG
mmetsp:Transcript_12786/g.38519  ORF Transcript_12786/g.38519 Transcript_12786/m.38519 type:complete len:309 (-) Transcript_12786:234-1160(-)